MLYIEVKVYDIFVNSDDYLLLLCETGRQGRFIPITINAFEADNIMISVEDKISDNCMIFDVFGKILTETGNIVEQILIYDIKDGIFKASLHICNINGEKKFYEIRPADGIALALRFKAPVFISGNVINDVSDNKVLQEEINYYIKNQSIEQRQNRGRPDSEQAGNNLLRKDLLISMEDKIEKLNLELDLAVQEENYEEAARIRDRIIIIKRLK